MFHLQKRRVIATYLAVVLYINTSRKKQVIFLPVTTDSSEETQSNNNIYSRMTHTLVTDRLKCLTPLCRLPFAA